VVGYVTKKSKPETELFAKILIHNLEDPKWEALRTKSPGSYMTCYGVWITAITTSCWLGLGPVSTTQLAKRVHLPKQTVRDAVAILVEHGLASVTPCPRPLPSLVAVPNIERYQIRLRGSPGVARTTVNAPLEDPDHRTVDRATIYGPPDVSLEPISGGPDRSHGPPDRSHGGPCDPHLIEARAGRDREIREREETDTSSTITNVSARDGAPQVSLSDPAGPEVLRSSEPSPLAGAAAAAGEGIAIPDSHPPSPAAQVPLSAPAEAEPEVEAAACPRVAFASLLRAPRRGVNGQVEWVGLSQALGSAFEAATRAARVPQHVRWGVEADEVLAALVPIVCPETLSVGESAWIPRQHGILFSQLAFHAATAFCETPWNLEAPLQRTTWRSFVQRVYTIFSIEANPELIALKKRIEDTKDSTLKGALLDTLRAARYGTLPRDGAPRRDHPATPHRRPALPAREDYSQGDF
jgi:hypothetical protein